MRLLVFGINYAPEPTGIGKYTGEMAEWLVGRGHRVDVITALPHYPSWRVDEPYRGRGFLHERVRGVDVYRAPLATPRGDGIRAPQRILLETSFHAAALRWWLPLAVRTRYDAVVSVSPPLQMAVLPWLYRVVRRVPWVLHVQDLQVDAAIRLGLLQPGLTSRALYGLEASLLRSATTVSTISPSMRDRVVHKGVAPERAVLFPNWSDTDFVRPMRADPAVRRTLGAREGDVLVLYAGNMGDKQGLDSVIDAAERLAHHDRIRFALVGDGSARHRLERRARDLRLERVRFLDVFPWADVPALLAAGDIHLVVQREEAADLVMPSKLTNILAAGRPSIGTANPDTELHRVLTDHRVGWVTPPGDVDALARSIARLADSTDERRELGRNAREYALEHLRKDAILGRFEAHLVGLTGSERNPRVAREGT